MLSTKAEDRDTASTGRTEDRNDRCPIKHEVGHSDRRARDKKDTEEKVKRVYRTESAGKWLTEQRSSAGRAA